MSASGPRGVSVRGLVRVCVLVSALLGVTLVPAGEVDAEDRPASSTATADTHTAATTADDRELAAAPANAITFSEHPLGTSITSQYQQKGVHFGGDSPFITDDGSNPTSPVLSGTPRFHGQIELRMVEPASGRPTTASGLQLDVGFIDSRNSVEIALFDRDGAPLGSTRANSLGINTIRLPLRGIAKVVVRATETEPAGFAIDNVVVNTATTTGPSARMIALGDSFTSGEGLVPEGDLRYDCATDLHEALYYENSTVHAYRGKYIGPDECDTTTGGRPSDEVFDRPTARYLNLCHRHGRAWPNQIRERLGISANNGLFVACSGAVTANIGYLPSAFTNVDSANRPQYRTPGSPRGVAGGNVQKVDAQNFAARRGQPDLVTIGVGGNDANFSEIVKSCLFKPCLEMDGWADSQLATVNGPVFDRLVATFTGVREHFPDARILTYGYPAIIDPSLTCAGLDMPGPNIYELGASEKAWAMETLLPELNQAIADAAATAGITFMPIHDVFAGHEICTDDPWANGVRLGSDKWGSANESFHPNQRGHDAIADFFWKHYTDGNGQLLFDNPAPNSAIRPDRGPITYNLGQLNVAAQGACGASCLQPQCTPGDCQLQLQGQGFSPDTELRVVAHSDPVDLGRVTTEADGSLRATLAIPATVPDGPHVIELHGVSTDGVVQQGVALIEIARTPHEGPGGVLRVEGDTRIETAIAAARVGFWDGADTAVIAVADNYPDALAGAPLAHMVGGPILLTGSRGLHAAVADELDRLGAKQAVLLGGTSALSEQVVEDLAGVGLRDVVRIAGADRFDTAARVAEAIMDPTSVGLTMAQGRAHGRPDHVFLTEGAHPNPSRGWPDALGVGPWAAITTTPILLTSSDTLPQATGMAIQALDVPDVTIVGGPVAVSADVADAVGSLGVSVERIFGPDRYATSAAVAERAQGSGLSPAQVWIATGRNFPDALAAGPVVAASGGSLLLADPQDLTSSSATQEWLVSRLDEVVTLRLLGGPVAIADTVATQLERLLQP